jgi:hypothetical protein
VSDGPIRTRRSLCNCRAVRWVVTLSGSRRDTERLGAELPELSPVQDAPRELLLELDNPEGDASRDESPACCEGGDWKRARWRTTTPTRRARPPQDSLRWPVALCRLVSKHPSRIRTCGLLGDGPSVGQRVDDELWENVLGQPQPLLEGDGQRGAVGVDRLSPRGWVVTR